MQEGSGTTYYAYDTVNRLTSRGEDKMSQRNVFYYDAASNLTCVRDPDPGLLIIGMTSSTGCLLWKAKSRAGAMEFPLAATSSGARVAAMPRRHECGGLEGGARVSQVSPVMVKGHGRAACHIRRGPRGPWRIWAYGRGV